MSQPLAFSIDDLDADRHVVAICTRCQSTRYLTRPLLREKAAGQTFAEVERRVRCIARPRSDRQEQACGGAMTLEFYRRPGGPEAQAATVALAQGLADFTRQRLRYIVVR